MTQRSYPKLVSTEDVAGAEEALIGRWASDNTFVRSIDERPASKPFVFYEGPPTANGRPGVHHVIARLCKDLACRYKTMQGFRVVRKAGWDTHGLPVEIEVENELGIKHKEEIEAFGVAEFNAKCRESVFRYEKDWVEFTRRIGFWLDTDHPYVTYDNRYIESVWWILKEFWKADLIYKGHKIIPYCPRCETSLSSHEVSLGYKEVSDPSVFVKFRRRGTEKEFFLVWTTTPWTLISNVALAVGPDHRYVRVRTEGDETLTLAETLTGVLEGDFEIIDRVAGSELVGETYEPLFDFYADAENAFRVVPGEFVSLEDGTGIVHIAPAFGEDDYQLHKQHGLPLVQAVTPSGTFEPVVTPWAGKFIKDADPLITRHLKDEGLLYKSGRVKHSYPFCWRCATPLIYYARKSWYIRTTSFKDRMIEANRAINWIPSEVGEYRFGNWLENNVDWSLSRERYWGTPLNIWECEACEARDAIGSIEELQERATSGFPEKADTIDLHRPMVDSIVLRCACGGDMSRVKEVIDVWFDSGSMPFAQYHYPWDEDGMFEGQFPADYISEGIDQSRGWFYSLLAISVFLKGVAPYRNCLTTEMILDKRGQKMSKSRGNAVEPWDMLNKEGADALRWYLVTTSPPWSPTRFDRAGVGETSRKMLDTLRNVYSFFAMYASIDNYAYSEEAGTPSLLDRWLLSRFHTTVSRVTRWLDEYEITRAARMLQAFVLDELSNWYVRRSRRRFWKGEMGPDKVAAYRTLYTVLEGIARLTAPYIPFLSEEIYLALRGDDSDSVHLAAFPEADARAVDVELESKMDMALSVTALARSVRNDHAVRTRQPLARVLVHATDDKALAAFLAHDDIVALVTDELNVKSIASVDDVDRYVSLAAKPNFPALGKRFGKSVPDVAASIRSLASEALLDFNRTGNVGVSVGSETHELGREELTVTVNAADGFGAREERGVTVIVDLSIDEALALEGAAREIINRIQNLRKKSGYEVTDRISLRFSGGERAQQVFATRGELIASETLAEEMSADRVDWPHAVELDLGGETVRLWIQKSR